MGVRWISYRHKGELEALAAEFNLDASGTVEDLRSRFAGFASRENHPPSVLSRLAKLEAQFGASATTESSLNNDHLRLEEGRVVAQTIVNGVAVAATLDTGASRSFINGQLAVKSFREYEFKEVRTRITLADGSAKFIVRVLEATVYLGTRRINMMLLVLPGMTDSLILGIDFLRAMGAVIQCGEVTLRFTSPKKIGTKTTVTTNPPVEEQREQPQIQHSAVLPSTNESVIKANPFCRSQDSFQKDASDDHWILSSRHTTPPMETATGTEEARNEEDRIERLRAGPHSPELARDPPIKAEVTEYLDGLATPPYPYTLPHFDTVDNNRRFAAPSRQGWIVAPLLWEVDGVDRLLPPELMNEVNRQLTIGILRDRRFLLVAQGFLYRVYLKRNGRVQVRLIRRSKGREGK